MKNILMFSLMFALFSAPVSMANSSTPTLDSAYSSKLVNVNTADKKTIASLQGIGERKAARIIAYRQQHGAFHSVSELTHVQGINKKSIAKLLKENPGRIMVK